MTETQMTQAEWVAEGERRFGPDRMKWKFVCPVCKHVATPEDFRQFKDKGARPNSATSECIGRYTGAGGRAFSDDGRGGTPQPCDYAGYGLIRLSPVIVTPDDGGEEIHCFAFADVPPRLVRDEQGNPLPPASVPIAGCIFGIYAEQPDGKIQPVMFKLQDNWALAIFSSEEKMRAAYAAFGVDMAKVTKIKSIDAGGEQDFLDSLDCAVILDLYVTAEGNKRFSLIVA